MNHQFWQHKKERINNPSYISKYVTNLLKADLKSQTTKKERLPQIKISERPHDYLKRSQSEVFKSYPQDSLKSELDKQKPSLQKNDQSKSNSKFSSYGSASLKQLRLPQNDVEVYAKQTREANIITNKPREYIESIKVFPKIRFQNYDNTYFRRKSFIEGNPENAFKYYPNDHNKNTKMSNFYMQFYNERQ